MEKTDYRDFEDASNDIPKKKFRSYFTWFLYETSRSYEPYAMVVWFGLYLYFPTAMSSLRFIVSLATVMLLLALTAVGLILTVLICINSQKNKAKSFVRRNIKAVAEATEEVFSSEQETLALGWDKVASKVNRKFYIAGEWKTPYYFFDGEQCEVFFRTHVPKRMYEEEAPAHDEKSCVRAAVSVYQQWLLDQFNRDKKATPVLADDNLPADSHCSKYIWRLKNSMKAVGFLVLFGCAWAYVYVGLSWFSRLYAIFVLLNVSFATLRTRYPSKIYKTGNLIRLLATIANVSPREDMDRWDLVAKRINAYLNKDFNDTGAATFFDGKDCRIFFGKELKPIMSKKTKHYRFELAPLVDEVVENHLT